MSDNYITQWTDKYFTKSRKVIEKNAPLVTYAVFVRRPTLMATSIAESWLHEVAQTQDFEINIQTNYQEGEMVGAGDPLLFITAPMDKIIETETIFLQKIGPACVAALNAYEMCCELPNVPFLAMDARHNVGAEMSDMMAYAASVGSKAAQKSTHKAKGFIGNATDATAHYFEREKGLGTIPHALIGAYPTTLDAAIAFYETYPNDPLTVLVDYYAQEVTDTLAVCNHFASLAKEGNLSIRLDTHGSRYLEGLSLAESYSVLERNAPNSIRQYRTEESLKYLVGTGTSAAAIWYMREQLDHHGFPNVKIVASSGFNTHKCRAMKETKAPIDVIGTGSFLPDKWSETFTTADVICYDGKFKVKSGREFLIKAYKERYGDTQKL